MFSVIVPIDMRSLCIVGGSGSSFEPLGIDGHGAIETGPDGSGKVGLGVCFVFVSFLFV